MALITRVSRLFRADIHAVLDRIEEPDVLLKQAVREMEDDITRDEQRIKVLTHEHGQLTVRHSELDQSLEQIEEQLNLCFASGKDDLARVLIRRKLEAQRLKQVLANKRDAAQETLADLRHRLEENRGRLTAMQQKLELLAEDETAVRSEAIWSTPDITVRDEDVEVALLREKQKRKQS